MLYFFLSHLETLQLHHIFSPFFSSPSVILYIFCYPFAPSRTSPAVGHKNILQIFVVLFYFFIPLFFLLIFSFFSGTLSFPPKPQLRLALIPQNGLKIRYRYPSNWRVIGLTCASWSLLGFDLGFWRGGNGGGRGQLGHGVLQVRENVLRLGAQPDRVLRTTVTTLTKWSA